MKYLLPTLFAICFVPGFAHAKLKLKLREDPTVNIASTSTEVCQRVFLGTITTRVDLAIGELILTEGSFQGTYSVNVDPSTVPAPFRFIAKSKNEAGQITLPFNDSFSEFAASGGTLKGHGYCVEKDKMRMITCEVIPSNTSNESGTIRLTIDTGNRVMDFVSEYVVRGG